MYLHNKERKFGQYTHWTEEDLELLKEKYKTLSIPKIHKEYFSDRSFASVEKKASYMGLRKFAPQIPWTEEEDQKLAEALENRLTTRKIYETIFSYRTYCSVKNRRFKLLKERKNESNESNISGRE